MDHIEELIINVNDGKFVINDINNKQMGYFTKGEPTKICSHFS